MCYHVLRWTGSSSFAHMQCQNPCHQPVFGSTGEGTDAFPTCCKATLLVVTLAFLCPATTCLSPAHYKVPLPWGAMAALATIVPLQCLAAATHSLLPLSPAGPLVHQVPLSHIHSASWAKLDEGLQHNTHRVYQCEQQMFQSF